jgi:pimeloyl-ACP methyl ester carboxylesterase
MPLLEPLAERFTVIAPDLPGFGKTPEPPDVWGGADYAAFVSAFLKAADVTPAAALGHSNGGRVLLRLAPGLQLRRLALLAPAGVKTRKRPGYYAKVYGYKAVKTLLRPFPRALERYRRGKGSPDYQSASPLMRGVMSRLLAEDLTPLLPAVAVPTLLIWGEGDTAAPYKTARVLCERIPDAGLVSLPGGHWAFMERLPVTLAALFSFFGSL